MNEKLAKLKKGYTRWDGARRCYFRHEANCWSTKKMKLICRKGVYTSLSLERKKKCPLTFLRISDEISQFMIKIVEIMQINWRGMVCRNRFVYLIAETSSVGYPFFVKINESVKIL